MGGPNGGPAAIDEARVARLTVELTGRINLAGAPVFEVLLALASVVRIVIHTAAQGRLTQRMLMLGTFVGDLYEPAGPAAPR